LSREKLFQLEKLLGKSTRFHPKDELASGGRSGAFRQAALHDVAGLVDRDCHRSLEQAS
jgi:hypothetical protein